MWTTSTIRALKSRDRPVGSTLGIAAAPRAPRCTPAPRISRTAAAPAATTALRLGQPAGGSLSPNPRKPPRLRSGDRIALVAPASPCDDESIELALANVRALGFEPVLGDHARAKREYLAGSDDERASDFNAALRDDSIRAIFALRGGYGTMRILYAIDYDAFARNPKVVMGYSDMTALLNSLAQRANVATFHGPIASAPMDRVAINILRTLTEAEPLGRLHIDGATHGNRIASGRLCGGNLSLIAHACGTPYALDMRDAIVFFEDVDEDAYRIDRLFTQLLLSGALETARGFILGDIPHLEVAIERLAPLKKPLLSGAPIGHIDDQWVIPIGIDATLDATNGTINFHEAAVD
jgi:muramoyltetrapeptide carboxypeptidase